MVQSSVSPITNFKLARKEFGPFSVYHGIGKQGEYHLRFQKQPYTRQEYRNAYLVIRGFIDCHGPDGYGIQRFEEGAVTTELPDYTHRGRYVFRPGAEGVEFYCITTKDRSPYSHKIVRLSIGEDYSVPVYRILAFNKGAFIHEGNTAAAPIILSTISKVKTIRAIQDCKAVELWQ